MQETGKNLSPSNNCQTVRLFCKLTENLRTGKWLPGQRLPSLRNLAAEHQVAINTAAAAVRMLQENKYVYIRRNSGAYVNEFEQWLDNDGSVNIAPVSVLGGSDDAHGVDNKVLYFLFHIDSRYDRYNMYGEIIGLMQEECDAINLQLHIGNAAKVQQVLKNTSPENTWGVIYLPDIQHPNDLEWPVVNYPKVLFSIGEKSLKSNYVTPDNYQGGCLAAEYLLRKHNNLLLLTSLLRSNAYLGERPFRDRLAGIVDYCRLQHVPDPEIITFSGFEGVKNRFSELLKLPREKRPGLICHGSVSISEFLNTVLFQLDGVRLEKEFDIVVFQDCEIYEDVPYATVNFSCRVLCREVLDLVRRVRKHPEDQPIRVKIPMFIRPAAVKKNTVYGDR